MQRNLEQEMDGISWTRLVGQLYYKQNNFVAMDLNEAETNFWPTVCLNTRLMWNTQISTFTEWSGYPILFMCSNPREILTKNLSKQ